MALQNESVNLSENEQRKKIMLKLEQVQGSEVKKKKELKYPSEG